MQYYQYEIEDFHRCDCEDWFRAAADYLAHTECSDFSEEVATSICANTQRCRRQQFPLRRLYMYCRHYGTTSKKAVMFT
jgi:hypothetical protein